jgi:hypothetical protein
MAQIAIPLVIAGVLYLASNERKENFDVKEEREFDKNIQYKKTKQKEDITYDIVQNDNSTLKTTITIDQIVDVIAEAQSEIPSPCDPTLPNPCCSQELFNYLNNTLETLQTKLI